MIGSCFQVSVWSSNLRDGSCAYLLRKSWSRSPPVGVSFVSNLKTGRIQSSLVETLVSFIGTLFGLIRLTAFSTRTADRARSMLVVFVSDAVRREPELSLPLRLQLRRTSCWLCSIQQHVGCCCFVSCSVRARKTLEVQRGKIQLLKSSVVEAATVRIDSCGGWEIFCGHCCKI